MVENQRKGMQLVKCMNHDPENSKWGDYAPEGGCNEKMYIYQNKITFHSSHH